VWAAGVTYATSRSARNEESGGHDFYNRVYDAERPEIFFKAAPGRVRGPGAQIGVRADSGWDVPEPELALVVNAGAEIVGYTIGNDVSSRSIEGENPLYLPQAKTYRGSCALGPGVVPAHEAPDPQEMEISLTISREGGAVFEGSTQVALLKRSPSELVEWLFKAQDFPVGVVLMTGTSVIPAAEFTLLAGDEVRIAITGLGELVNTVEVVGA
jgi:2-dehydro-3-deoxy-D-arabinonate dehydratase